MLSHGEAIHRQPALLASLLLLLAGCAADGPSGQAAGLEYGADTGAIAGTVLDESLLPVADVRVVLDSASEDVTTADGAFHFSNVVPGTHTVLVSRDGFLPVERALEVRPQEILDVRIQLVRVGAALAYHETKIGVSFVGCGVGVRNQQLNNPPAGVGGAAVCSSLPANVQNATNLQDKFRLDWKLGSLETMTGIYAESKWRSTQVLGKSMRVRWYFGASGGQLGPFLGELDAPSPLSFRFPIEVLRTNASITPVTTASGAAGSVSAEQCLTEACPFVSFHYAGRSNLGPTYPVDFGFAMQQRIDDYLTAFYRETFPDRFSALPDQ